MGAEAAQPLPRLTVKLEGASCSGRDAVTLAKSKASASGQLTVARRMLRGVRPRASRAIKLMGKRDFVSEIVDRRRRLPQVRSMYLLLDRLRELEHAFERRDQLSDELMRYFPVAIVACLEGFFRELVRELIDHGPPFSDRIDLIENSRIDMQVLKAIHGRTVTVGEFIAHQVPLSSLENINSVMTTLLGEDFVTKLKTVRSAWSDRLFGENSPPLLGDAAAVLRGTAEAFRLRHILAHELATAFPVTREAAERAFSSGTAFIYAANELVEQLLNPDEPITQSQMTQAAARRYDAAEVELKTVVAQLESALPEQKLSVFRDGQQAWIAARESTARLHADLIAEGGSMWPQMYYGMMREMTENRITDLRLMAGNLPSV